MPADPSKWEMVDDAMAAILRRKSEAERLAIAFGMSRFVQQMIQANLSAEHPEWTAEQIRREAARRSSHGAACASATTHGDAGEATSPVR